MKKIVTTSLLFSLLIHASGQGSFLVSINPTRTRLGAPDGPFAETNILGQFLVGRSPDSLTPVGPLFEHHNGYIGGPTITVPGIDGDETAYFQLVAWNSTLWGTSLENVPVDQFGRTDIVPKRLSYSFQPATPPAFTQPAIIPVPEPSILALISVAALAFFLVRRGNFEKAPQLPRQFGIGRQNVRQPTSTVLSITVDKIAKDLSAEKLGTSLRHSRNRKRRTKNRSQFLQLFLRRSLQRG